MSLVIGMVRGGLTDLGQTRTFDKHSARDLQELLVKACTLKPEQVDGQWSPRATGTSRQAMLAAARKYRAEINAAVGKSASAKVYNWAIAITGTNLREVRVSPAGFVDRLATAINNDPKNCAAGQPSPFVPIDRPVVFEPGMPTQPISTETSVCQQFISGTPLVLASMDQQAVNVIKVFDNYKKGMPGQAKALRAYISWFDKTGEPAAKKIASQLKVCGRQDLQVQLLNKLNTMREGVNTIRQVLQNCKTLTQSARNLIRQANRTAKDIERAAARKQWDKMKKLIAVAEQLLIPALRTTREAYTKQGCGDSKKWRDRLFAAIKRLKAAVKAGRRARKAWLRKQKEEEKPPVVVEEEEAPPTPVEEEEEEEEFVVAPEEEEVPVDEDEEEEKPGFALFQNPWPWILGGAALVFGVVAATTAAERKKQEGRLPATAGYGRYRR